MGEQTRWPGKGSLAQGRARRELCSLKARAGEAEAADPAPGHPQKCTITNRLSVSLHTYVLP